MMGFGRDSWGNHHRRRHHHHLPAPAPMKAVVIENSSVNDIRKLHENNYAFNEQPSKEEARTKTSVFLLDEDNANRTEGVVINRI
jgi:hypothetical protein